MSARTPNISANNGRNIVLPGHALVSRKSAQLNSCGSMSWHGYRGTEVT
ncbi:hypothetical protein [Arthrobacter sp. A2-55]|nr:hypothetical protein [Arthrobacter sp. A2-55]MCU6481308.1 hypothetical protein [Arthrobacter sp. A2-55]